MLAAAQADFVVCLYNPSSKKRHDYLQKACDLMMQYKSEDTVCGIVSYIGRDGRNTKGYVIEGIARYSGRYVYHGLGGKFSDKRAEWKNGDAKRIQKCIKLLFLPVRWKAEKWQNI